MATAVTWTEARFIPGMWQWLPLAVAGGCWLHLLGDLLTPEGVPLLWPWRQRLAIPVIDHTDSWGETFVVVPALGVVVLGLAWVQFATARAAAVAWLTASSRGSARERPVHLPPLGRELAKGVTEPCDLAAHVVACRA